MNNKTIFNGLIILGLVLSLSACMTPAKIPDHKPMTQNKTSIYQQLNAMNWTPSQLQASGQSTTVFNSGVALNTFKIKINHQGATSFKGQCNLHMGQATFSGDGQVKFSQFGGTMMGCPAPLMQADSEMSKLLMGMRDYQLSGSQLRLSGNNKTLILNGSPTDETRYGGEGKRRFVEIKNYPDQLVWREVFYDSRGLLEKEMPWQQGGLPAIRDFKLRPNAHNVVRIKEYRDPSGQGMVWVKDMVVRSGSLN